MIMDNGTLALLIPLAAMMIPFLAIWTKHQRRIEEIRAASTAEKAAQYAAGNERLEERVRVLERIITDRGTSLANEIDALRAQDADGTTAKKLQ
jgi:hypothetical protein